MVALNEKFSQELNQEKKNAEDKLNKAKQMHIQEQKESAETRIKEKKCDDEIYSTEIQRIQQELNAKIQLQTQKVLPAIWHAIYLILFRLLVGRRA